MIKTTEMWGAVCDGCGTEWDNGDCISHYADRELIESALRDAEWHVSGDKCWCAECWSYDDNDNIVVKANEIPQSPSPAPIDKAYGLAWVEIKEGCELPEIDEPVLFWREDGMIFQNYLDKEDALMEVVRHLSKIDCEITHWARIQGPGESPASVTDQRHADAEKAIAFAEEMARQGWTYHGDGRWFNLLRKKGLFATTAEVYREVYPEYTPPVDPFLEWMNKRIEELKYIQRRDASIDAMFKKAATEGRMNAFIDIREQYLSLHPQAKP
jgi:predicted transcriptional regulator